MTWEKLIQSGLRMPFYMNMYVEGQRNGIKDITGWSPSSSLVVIERQMNVVYYSKEEMKTYQDFIIPELKKKVFRDKFLKDFYDADYKLLQICRKIYFRDYKEVPLVELEKQLREFVNAFSLKFGIYGLPKFTDVAMQDILSKILSIKIEDNDLLTLTKSSIESEYVEERINFLNILEEIRALKLLDLFMKLDSEIYDTLARYHPSLYSKIEDHVKRFEWLGVTHLVMPMNLSILIKNIKEGLKDSKASEELDNHKHSKSNIEKEQKILSKKLSLTKEDEDIINFIKNLNEINESRKISMSKSILWSYPLIQAIALRLNIDSISLRQLTHEEIFEAIKQNKISSSQRRLIEERLGYYVCLLKNDKIQNISGEKAKITAKQELGITDYQNIKEIKGSIAQKGDVKGKVRLILSEHQINQLIEGEILVTSMTDPDMVPAMKKASAIITDEGGITCHAAIISRELKIPCIIGTKIATKVLKNGDEIEVDAEKGIVKIIKRA